MTLDNYTAVGIAEGFIEAASQEDPAEFLGDWVGESDVGDDAVAEEGLVRSAFGASEELVGQDAVAGAVGSLERADGADADDPGDAEFLEGKDVGPVIEFAGEPAMGTAVAGEEDDVASGQATGEKGVGGGAEGG